MLILLTGLILFTGALVQGTVGFGMNLIAAPLLALVDPALVPVPLLVVSSAHAVLSLVRERTDTDWRGVWWATLGRVPGAALGVAAVAVLAPRPFAAIVGVSVLACVALSVTSWRPSPERGPLLVAGVASGVFGTAAAIGGPPVALLYQHRAGPQVRSTLAACFTLGSVVSLAGLALGGELHTEHLLRAAWLLPFLIAGFVVSGPARRFMDGGRIRGAVLLVAAGSAVALLLRSVIG